MSLKWFALGAVVAACLGYLIFAATGTSAEYYQTISEMRSHQSTRNIRVIGTVQDDVVRTEGGLRVQFTASDGDKIMPVDYRGTVPDIFRPGIQVVVEGRIEPDGVFHAKAMEAKCPSRFSTSVPAPASTG